MNKRDKKTLVKRFARQLREARDKRRWSRNELAIMSAVSASQIRDIEDGKRTAGLVIAYALAQALDLSLDELCEAQEASAGGGTL